MSESSIRSLVYISTAKAGLQESDHAAIVDISRRNNEQSGITGLLAFNGTNFMQLLEGSSAAVSDCMATISSDPRHNGVVVLSREETTDREFPDWYMASLTVGLDRDHDDKKLIQILGSANVNEETRKIFTNFASLGMPSDDWTNS